MKPICKCDATLVTVTRTVRSNTAGAIAIIIALAGVMIIFMRVAMDHGALSNIVDGLAPRDAGEAAGRVIGKRLLDFILPEWLSVVFGALLVIAGLLLDLTANSIVTYQRCVQCNKMGENL